MSFGDEDWDEPEPLVGPLALTEIIVEVTENPIVAELLGPDGNVLRQWRERPQFGFHSCNVSVRGRDH